ncbi:MAG: gephyrin-like molybdotransferase Glp [Pseudomonadota bacterium]
MTDPSTCTHPTDNSLALVEARARIAEHIRPIDGHEQLALGDALGRVLAEDALAPLSVPQHRNSAMDGYAFRHADAATRGATTLTLVGQSLAGHPHGQCVEPGGAVRIMTGAVVPDGLDTVVVQEVVDRLDGDRIRFDGQQTAAGDFVRGIGDDIQQGHCTVSEGTRLRAAELGVLASLGVSRVPVLRRPRVAVMSTGDELRSAGEPLDPGQIYDSNRTTLTALLRTHHAEPVDIGQVPDTPDDIHRALDEAARTSDVILSSGGVSVGVADHMRDVLAREGTLAFWKIAVKPGRPLVFGRWKTAWYFGLPGNPVSAMVTFDQLVRPALAQLAGEAPRPPVRLRARVTGRLTKQPGRLEFQRGTLANADDGSLTVTSTGSQDSHVLTSLTAADCLICLPRESSGAESGEWVTVLPLRDSWGL